MNGKSARVLALFDALGPDRGIDAAEVARMCSLSLRSLPHVLDRLELNGHIVGGWDRSARRVYRARAGAGFSFERGAAERRLLAAERL